MSGPVWRGGSPVLAECPECGAAAPYLTASQRLPADRRQTCKNCGWIGGRVMTWHERSITLALIDAQILSEIRECAARPAGHDHYYTDAGTLRCHDCDLEERA